MKKQLVLISIALLALITWIFWLRVEKNTDNPMTSKGKIASPPSDLTHREAKATVNRRRLTAATNGKFAKQQELKKIDNSEAQASKVEEISEASPRKTGVGEQDEEDYSEYDEIMNRGVPLEMIGIPQYYEATTLVFQPTEADRQRLQEIEEEMREAAGQGLLSHKWKAGYVPMDVDPDETVYVHPDYLAHYKELLEEDKAIHERSMRQVPGRGYTLTPSKGRILPDGTKLVYYRRVDGALIRCVTKPDGTVRRWVIGWADLSEYPQELREDVWREE